MWFDYLLKNLLYYFLPSAVVWSVGVLTLAKLKRKREFLVGGNIALLVVVVLISLLTIPPVEPLEVEIAFYALAEQPDTTYVLYSLLGEGPPAHLGLRDSLGQMKGLPAANSGDGLQLRLKLNRKGYAYVFHFDTTALELRQLFPAREISAANPLPAESWLELPAAQETWPLDVNPGLETFMILISTAEQNDASSHINKLLEKLKGKAVDKSAMFEKLERELSTFGSCLPVGTKELAHSLHNTFPTVVTTRRFRGQQEESMLFWKLIQHK